MTWLIVIVIGAVGAAIVLAPFFRKETSEILPERSENAGNRRRLREEKANLLLALRELDFDYETGKLSAADYKSLREKYESRTVVALKSLEELDRRWQTVESWVSGEVTKRLGVSVTPSAFCAHCGKPIPPESRFCAFCGKGRVLQENA